MPIVVLKGEWKGTYKQRTYERIQKNLKSTEKVSLPENGISLLVHRQENTGRTKAARIGKTPIMNKFPCRYINFLLVPRPQAGNYSSSDLEFYLVNLRRQKNYILASRNEIPYQLFYHQENLLTVREIEMRKLVSQLTNSFVLQFSSCSTSQISYNQHAM